MEKVTYTYVWEGKEHTHDFECNHAVVDDVLMDLTNRYHLVVQAAAEKGQPGPTTKQHRAKAISAYGISDIKCNIEGCECLDLNKIAKGH